MSQKQKYVYCMLIRSVVILQNNCKTQHNTIIYEHYLQIRFFIF
jgi:hypothetical protein